MIREKVILKTKNVKVLLHEELSTGLRSISVYDEDELAMKFISKELYYNLLFELENQKEF